MEIFSRFRHYIYNSFREFFVYHYSSLNFRAELFALVIGVNPDAKLDNFLVVKQMAMQIYNNDEERANVLLFSTKEIVNDVKNNIVSIDSLINKIQKELKHTPRYAKKIDVEALRPILSFTYDEDIFLYQQNILEFLDTLKKETLTQMQEKKFKRKQVREHK